MSISTRIEAIQKKALLEFGVDLAEFHDMNASILERVKARLPPSERATLEADLRDNSAGRFQSPHRFFSLRKLLSKVDQAALEIGCAVRPPPVIASYLGCDINGHVTRTDDDEQAICIDEAFFDFALCGAKLVLQALLPDEPNEPLFSHDKGVMLARFRRSREPYEQFADILTSAIVGGSVVAAKHRELPADKAVRQMVSSFSEGMNLFLIGHEYGHLALGHLEAREFEDVDAIRRMTFDHDQYSAQGFHSVQRFEYEADQFALAACMQIQCTPMETAMHLVGIDFMLKFLDLLTALKLRWVGQNCRFTQSPLEFSIYSTSVHPPGAIRAGLIANSIKDSDLHATFIEQHLAASNAMTILLSFYWEVFTESVPEALIAKTKPHKRWSREFEDLQAMHIIDG